MANRWMNAVLTGLAAASLLSTSAAAQQTLPLKAGKAWKHKHSGIIVPATLAGTPREQGMAYAPDDLDVGLSFVVGDAVESLTFYIFRNTNGGVPVWFSQAQWGIENRDTYGHPPIVVAPQAFVPPGQRIASGLKAIYAPKSGSYRSTGIMLLPVGDWYVKVRGSSQTRSPEELSAWMDAALAEIKWPKKIESSALAVPVMPCATPLVFSIEAKDAPKDSSADLLGGVLGMMVADGQVKPTPESEAALANTRWCRDASVDGSAAVYRRDEDPERYLLAVGDNGNGIWVEPDAGAALLTTAQKDAPVAPRFSIKLMMAARDVNFVAQDRLPSPQRVLSSIEANRSTTSVSTWGKKSSITVNSDGL